MVAEFTPHAWQTNATEDYFRLGGVVCWMDAGCGKTYTAASIARRCPRPLVVAPAGVIKQTMAMFESYGVKCCPAKLWDPRLEREGAVHFASYTWLQKAAQAEFFERFRPSDVLLDEFHLCRNLKTNSAAKRLNRHLVARPPVRVAVFTASPWSRGLGDVAPGLRFALRKRAPLPPTNDGVEMLAERLASDPDARREWFARLAATPGVYLDSDGAGAYQGRVELRVIRREPALTLPDTWELPDGWLLGSASEAAGAARNLAWGFYKTRTPRPTPEFLEARRAWGQVVRRVTERGAADTESQVRELRPGEWAAYQAVAERQPAYREEAVWQSRGSLVATLAQTERPSGTIIWANSVELQRAVAEYLGCPWHHEQGEDANGVRLDEATAPVVVASMRACSVGFNPQARFHHNLVLEPLADQELMKQLIARTARQGQPRDVVTVDLVLNCREAEYALRQSIERARVAYEATGKRNPLLQLESEFK